MKNKGEKLYETEKRLSTYEGNDKVVSSHELAEELKKTEESVFIIPTGVESYDRLHEGGVEAGELIIVTGPTGEGKTSFLMSITKNMANSSHNSIWFTLEVTPRQFLKKIIAKDSNLPLFYVPRENTENQITWIEDRIIEAKVKYDAKVVFIDHIHQIFSIARMSSQSNLSFELGDLVAKIKKIAIDNNLVIFLIAHSKDDPSGTAREPRKEDIRDSGLISRLADSIVGVWRVPNDEEIDSKRRKEINENDTKSKVRVFKNRRTGKVGAWFMFHANHYLSENDPAFKDF
jgi:replicative DNA helicase